MLARNLVPHIGEGEQYWRQMGGGQRDYGEAAEMFLEVGMRPANRAAAASVVWLGWLASEVRGCKRPGAHFSAGY